MSQFFLRRWIWNRDRGFETPDPTPHSALVEEQEPLGIREELQRFVRMSLSRQAEQNGHGSFEDEDDFEPDEDQIDMLTPYEAVGMYDELGPLAETLDGKDPPKQPEETVQNPDTDETGKPAVESA